MPKKDKYKSVKFRDDHTSETRKKKSTRRSYTKSRQSSNRSRNIRDKRRPVKHIMIRGHGSLAPTEVSFN